MVSLTAIYLKTVAIGLCLWLLVGLSNAGAEARVYIPIETPFTCSYHVDRNLAHCIYDGDKDECTFGSEPRVYLRKHNC